MGKILAPKNIIRKKTDEKTNKIENLYLVAGEFCVCDVG